MVVVEKDVCKLDVGREARKTFHVYLYTFCFFESFECIIYSIIMSSYKKKGVLIPVWNR